jgi:hypothetical protein
MSYASYAAIHEVTKALRKLLHSQLVLRSGSAKVTLLPPGDTLPDVSGVNLYLYQVVESPSTRNQPWPGDRKTPPSNQPALGLRLFYLLTPLSTPPDDSSELGDDAHTMLGVAMQTLQENPVLNDIHLPGFDADSVLPDYLLNSYEQVKIYLMPTDLEALSRIWATINQPYRLSVSYEISLVELIPNPPPPVGGGIVTSTDVTVITLDAPRLTALTPTIGALVHIVGGTVTPNSLLISGFGFSFPGQPANVQVGGQPVVIDSVPAPTDQALTVALPTDLDAGPQANVQVTLNGRASIPLQFIVSPWLNSLTPIRTALDPANGANDLHLVLAGSGFTATPQAVRFDSPAASTAVTTFIAASDTQASVVIPTSLPNGVYSVRIVLGDAASSASNSRSLEVIPLVSSPIGIAVVGSVHQLTINGNRLAGTDIRLVIDGATYVTGPNANPTQLVYTLGRLLSVGSHSIAVNVDGHLSRSIDLEV